MKRAGRQLRPQAGLDAPRWMRLKSLMENEFTKAMPESSVLLGELVEASKKPIVLLALRC